MKNTIKMSCYQGRKKEEIPYIIVPKIDQKNSVKLTLKHSFLLTSGASYFLESTSSEIDECVVIDRPFYQQAAAFVAKQTMRELSVICSNVCSNNDEGVFLTQNKCYIYGSIIYS